MKTLTLDSVDAFISDIERATDLTLLKQEHGILLSKHLIDRIGQIDTLCESFRKSIVAGSASVPVVQSERSDVLNIEDSEYLAQIRDTESRPWIRHLAGCLLKLAYEVRYPNEPSAESRG